MSGTKVARRNSSSYTYGILRAYELELRAQRREEERRRNEMRELERERRRLEREREAERQRKLEEERRRKLEEERKRAIRQSWDRLQSELSKQIDRIKSSPERKQLAKLLKDSRGAYIQAMDNHNTSSAENLINKIRQDIASKQTDERMIASKQDEFSKFLSKLEGKAPAGFIKEIKALRNSDLKSGSSSIEEQNKKIRSLMSEAQHLAGEISIANSISLDQIVEDTFIIPPVITADEKLQEAEAAENMSLVNDICDFGGRVAFFSEGEANQLKPLIAEAKGSAENSRLKLIRTQVKTTYNRLREEAILTDIYKRDFNDFLPTMRLARNTEDLCRRMEDLLTASVISRNDYNEIYKSVKIVLAEQLDTITDALFADKIAATLNEMGYNLIDENGNPADLPPDTMRMIETPYEGYRVRVRVSSDNKLTTRLVRVVGSEEEKTLSEYQRQQDIETAKKWRENIMDFYKTLENDGIKMDIVFSKEPDEEPLDVVVDKSFKTRQHRTAAAERQQEQLQQRKAIK